MRVLVMGSDPHGGDRAALELAEAGHEVVRCSDPDSPSFPCKGMGDGCPLDTGVVDVALLVRQHPWPRPTPAERGVVCAHRKRVPVVVAGKSVLHPYEEWAAVVVHGEDGAVEACEQAASQALPAHGAVATDALHQVLHVAGRHPEGSGAEVRRREGRLLVTVSTPEVLAPREVDVVAVRIVAAIRRHDQAAVGIDVLFA